MMARDGRGVGSIWMLPSLLNGRNNWLAPGFIKRPYVKPDSLPTKIIEISYGARVQGSALRHAEPDHPWMHQLGESALPDQTLESVVRLPVALTRATQKFKFDHQAVMLSANNNVETMQPVQSHSCPRLARFPAIWAAMDLRRIDEPVGTVGVYKLPCVSTGARGREE